MEQIYVLGKCNNILMTKVDLISIKLERLNLPAKIFPILKEESEWEGYIKKICSLYGFYQKEHLDILSFKQEGTLIGDFNQFQEYCKKKWGISTPEQTEDEENKAVEVNKLIKQYEKDEETISNLEQILLQKKTCQITRVDEFERVISKDGKILRIKFSDNVIRKKEKIFLNSNEIKTDKKSNKYSNDDRVDIGKILKEESNENKRKSLRINLDANELQNNIENNQESKNLNEDQENSSTISKDVSNYINLNFSKDNGKLL